MYGSYVVVFCVWDLKVLGKEGVIVGVGMPGLYNGDGAVSAMLYLH